MGGETGYTPAFAIQRVGDEIFKNGQEARLKVNVSNLTSTSQDAVLIVALYRTDGGNKMVNYAYVSQTIRAGKLSLQSNAESLSSSS